MPKAPAPHSPVDRQALVETYFEYGRRAWPGLALERATFEAYLGRHVSAGVRPVEAHAADMYLACACAQGLREALTIFERTLVGEIARAVASVDSSEAFVEEIVQATREKLFVRKGEEPGRIASYGGRASLRTWTCAVAVRWALSVRRRKGEQAHRHVPCGDERLAGGGPEFDYLRGRYKHVFEEAVRRGVKQLSAKERLLLRLNVVDGMSIDAIAAVYKVGRSTAARWLSSARTALFDRARNELGKTLGLTSAELDSIAGAMISQLDVSVLRLLAGSAARQA